MNSKRGGMSAMAKVTKRGPMAYAESVGRQQEHKRESQGRRHVAETRFSPQARLCPAGFYQRRDLRMSSEMKGCL